MALLQHFWSCSSKNLGTPTAINYSLAAYFSHERPDEFHLFPHQLY